MIVKRGGVCVSPQTQRLDAQHKNFIFRVVSVCVSSSAFFSFFSWATSQVDNQWQSTIKPCFDIHLVTFLEKAHVESTRRGCCCCSWCSPKENFCLQRWLGLFGCEVGGGMRVRTAALCLLGLISQFEWESSVSFPPGPEAETSREPPSWWSDR